MRHIAAKYRDQQRSLIRIAAEEETLQWPLVSSIPSREGDYRNLYSHVLARARWRDSGFCERECRKHTRRHEGARGCGGESRAPAQFGPHSGPSSVGATDRELFRVSTLSWLRPAASEDRPPSSWRTFRRSHSRTWRGRSLIRRKRYWRYRCQTPEAVLDLIVWRLDRA